MKNNMSSWSIKFLILAFSLGGMSYACENMQGRWEIDGPGGPVFNLNQMGCRIVGAMEQGAARGNVFTQIISGNAIPRGANLSMSRTNPAGCVTVVYFRVMRNSYNNASFQQLGSDGRCDVPTKGGPRYNTYLQ